MRQQRNERNDQFRSQQNRWDNDRNSSFSGQDRNRWQGQNSQDRNFTSDFSGEAYRSDDKDGYNTRAPGDDYGSSRSFDNDHFSRESSGWGRGASEEESRSYGGSRGDVNSQNHQTSRWDRESDDSSLYGAQRTSYGQPQRRQGSQDQDYGRQQGVGSLNRQGSSYQGQGFENQAWGSSGSQQGFGAQGYNSQNQNRWQGGSQEAMGRHFGKGPKGYKRSDERIKEEVSEVLTRHHDIDASDIDVEVKEGEVTLTGFVSERRMKHMAEDAIENCMGVKDVTNNLRVRKDEGRSESSSSMDGDSERGTDKKSASSKKSGSTSTTNPSH